MERQVGHLTNDDEKNAKKTSEDGKYKLCICCSEEKAAHSLTFLRETDRQTG